MMMMHGPEQLQIGRKKPSNLKHNKIYDVIIIGAGISGLSAAYKAQKKGLSVLVLEKEQRCGGVIQSIKTELGNFEQGPNSFAINSEILELIKELDLKDQLVYANNAAQKRYIYLNNRPTLINPKKLLFSSEIISTKGKIKLLTERFKKVQTIANETLADAVRRRFSDEILQNLVNPVISGIYAGDTEKLEYKSSLKKLYQFEQEMGSFTKGFLKSKKSGEKREVVTFKNGLQQLTERIAKKLEEIILYEGVNKIEYKKNHIVVFTEDKTYITKKIIISTPAYVTGELLSSLDQSLATKISNIHCPPLLSLQLAYDKAKVKSHLDAFGLLIPKQAKKTTLGIINYSSVFNSNDKHYQYNLFIAVKEQITEDYISKLISQATQELSEIYQIDGGATYCNHKIWNKAIPQFNVGHSELMEEVDAFENIHPKIKIIGNWRTGVAIGDCIQL